MFFELRGHAINLVVSLCKNLLCHFPFFSEACSHFGLLKEFVKNLLCHLVLFFQKQPDCHIGHYEINCTSPNMFERDRVIYAWWSTENCSKKRRKTGVFVVEFCHDVQMDMWQMTKQWYCHKNEQGNVWKVKSSKIIVCLWCCGQYSCSNEPSFNRLIMSFVHIYTLVLSIDFSRYVVHE